MKSIKWNFSAGEMKGLTPFLAGNASYEASADTIQNMLVNFRGYLEQRPPVRHCAWLWDILNNGTILALIPHTYQTTATTIYGAMAFVGYGVTWVACFIPCDPSIAPSQCANQTNGPVSVLGTLSDSNGNYILVKDSNNAFYYVQFNGALPVITPKAFTSVVVASIPYFVATPPRPSGATITYQSRLLTIAQDGKSIIGSKVNNFLELTIKTANLNAEDPFIVTLETQGKIKNLMPVKAGVIVFTDDSQYLLAPGDTGLLTPALINGTSSISSQKLTAYQMDSEARMSANDLIFMANRTINKYQFSNDLQAYQAGRIAPTVQGKYVECFEAGGKYYAVCFDNIGDYSASLVEFATEATRSVTFHSEGSIRALCAGDDGFFMVTDSMIGFCRFYNYDRVPLDWYQKTTVAGLPGTGAVNITWRGPTVGLKAFFFDPSSGFRSLEFSYISQTLTIEKAKLITRTPQDAVEVYIGFDIEMKVQLHQTDSFYQDKSGAMKNTIGLKKNIEFVSVHTNAAQINLNAISPEGDFKSIVNSQPEGTPASLIRKIKNKLMGALTTNAAARADISSTKNADREVLVYGIETEWQEQET